MSVRVGRPADVLKQHEDAAHGGEGWAAREGSLLEELGSVWAECGVRSECGVLRAVLMRRPGAEIEEVDDPRKALWFDLLDPRLARAQHDALAAVYREHGVTVHYVEEVPLDKPNAYFCRDLFAMTPTGAVIARTASRARAGEERYAAAALARVGVPILHTVHGEGTFEGADVVVVSEDLVFVGQGMRTNRVGAEQVAAVYRRVGVPRVEIVQIPYGCGHIDGTVNLVDRDLAVVFPTQLSYVVYETLRQHGYRILDLPDAAEAQLGMALNMVPLAPGVVVMPSGNPITRCALERAGVECIEVEVAELMKGAGAVHCMTGVVKREAL